MTQPFLHIPRELLLQIEVLAQRYLEKPTPRMEEQMLVLLTGSMKRHCDNVVAQGTDMEDLLQIARLASTKAIRTYNPAKGSFYRWSRRCVWQDISHHLQNEGLLIQVPRNLQGKVTIEFLTLEQLEALERETERDN